MEVDLQTLQVVSRQPFEWTITTMSTAQPTIPLTVGTFHGIHLYDSRDQIKLKRDGDERIDAFDRLGTQGFSHIMDPRLLPP